MEVDLPRDSCLLVGDCEEACHRQGRDHWGQVPVVNVVRSLLLVAQTELWGAPFHHHPGYREETVSVIGWDRWRWIHGVGTQVLEVNCCPALEEEPLTNELHQHLPSKRMVKEYNSLLDIVSSQLSRKSWSIDCLTARESV